MVLKLNRVDDNRTCFHCLYCKITISGDLYFCDNYIDEPRISFDDACTSNCRDYKPMICKHCLKPIDVNVEVSQDIKAKQMGWQLWMPWNYGLLCYDCFLRLKASKLAVPLDRFGV